MLFSIRIKQKKNTSLTFLGGNYVFFKLRNLIFFKLHSVLFWILEGNTFFLELNINKISFLFFKFFAKYINKVVSLKLLSNRVIVDSDLEMQGLGFEIYRITKRIYRFFCGYVSYIYLIVPDGLEILNSTRKKKKLLIRGFEISLVKSFINMLKLLRGFNAYRAVGFFEPRVLVRLRSGKKK